MLRFFDFLGNEVEDNFDGYYVIGSREQIEQYFNNDEPIIFSNTVNVRNAQAITVWKQAYDYHFEALDEALMEVFRIYFNK